MTSIAKQSDVSSCVSFDGVGDTKPAAPNPMAMMMQMLQLMQMMMQLLQGMESSPFEEPQTNPLEDLFNKFKGAQQPAAGGGSAGAGAAQAKPKADAPREPDCDITAGPRQPEGGGDIDRGPMRCGTELPQKGNGLEDGAIDVGAGGKVTAGVGASVEAGVGSNAQLEPDCDITAGPRTPSKPAADDGSVAVGLGSKVSVGTGEIEGVAAGATGVAAEIAAAPAAAEPKKGAVSVEQTLLDNFDKLKGADNLVTLQTVNEVAQGMDCPNGEKPSAELQKACQSLVENPAAFKAIETFDNKAAPADMKIGSGDLADVIKEASLKSERTILDNFDKLKGPNNLITLQTINEVAAGGKCPDGSPPSPELRAACQDMVKNPEKFKTAETAAPGAPQDMLLGTLDLKTLLGDV